MSKVALSKNGKYKNGYYTLVYPEKYVGDPKNVIYRSSWEKRVCEWFDLNVSVVYWNSEGLIIPYFFTLDKKFHKYHIDFMAKIRDRQGKVKTYVIEVKPEKEQLEPTTRIKKRQMIEIPTYIKNQCKWEAAKAFCKERGMEFLVLNEYDLGIKQRSSK